MLEPVVDPQRRIRHHRRRTALVVAFVVVQAVLVVGLVQLRRHDAVWVVRPPPQVVVRVEPPPSAPPAPPAPPPIVPALDCPSLAPDDDPIGVAVTPDAREPETAASMHVVAAAHAPRVAVLTGRNVLVSDDDGRSFRAAFAGHDVDEIRIDRDGVLYARAGAALGIRSFPGRSEHWRDVAIAQNCPSEPCEMCRDRIVAVDDRVVWFHNNEVVTSRDAGKTWRPGPTDAPWSAAEGAVFAWRGAVYQVEHYTDMCGIDDSPVWRLSGTAVANTIFHNAYELGGSVLAAADDVGVTWGWRERCWADEPYRFAACSDRNSARFAMLVAKTLLPVEGARTLAVYNASLVELCADGARQVYRAFPFDHVDAVDALGRPLVVRDGAVLRWSPAHGWRRLYQALPPVRDGE